MTDNTSQKRTLLESKVEWVPLGLIRVPPEGEGQRELKEYRVNKILSKGFNPDIMGFPVVSYRDGSYWIIDGLARAEAAKHWLGSDWAGQKIQCRVFRNLTVAQESELFLDLNDSTAVGVWPRWANAITAGRPDECEVNRIVRNAGLKVARDRGDSSVGCIAALLKIFRRAGSDVTERALVIARDAYGKAGFEGHVLDGLSLLCQRYNGQLDDREAVSRLAAVNGGLSGLTNRAATVRHQTGCHAGQAIAVAAVEIINSAKGGKKLPKWAWS